MHHSRSADGFHAPHSVILSASGLVSSLPYIAQLIFETGIFNATLVFFKQLIAGVVAFTIFRMQVRDDSSSSSSRNLAP